MTLVMVSPAEASPREFPVDGGGYRITLDYFGRSARSSAGEEAFLIGLHERTLAAHFHPVDQFQLLLGGHEGSLLARTPVPALLLHYADAYSTYGPLVGGDPPMRFFTLRAEATDVTAFMPEDRELLAWRGRRNLHLDPFALAPGLPGSGELEKVVLVPEEADGLKAVMLLAGAGAEVTIPGGRGSAGRYCYVAEGAFGYEGRDYPAESLGFVSPTDDPAEAVAGTSGLRLLVLTFPNPPTPLAHAAGA